MDATTSALQTLGMAPEVGRIFTPEEEQWSNRHVVLLTHGLWKDKFGANPNIAGQTIRLDTCLGSVGNEEEAFAASVNSC
jgi:hypothetical protein